MMSMMKKRREAERNKNLEAQFVKKDANRNGRINAEQMVQIFKDNEVQVPNLEKEVAKLPDKDGWILFNDFMKLAVTTDLCKIDHVERASGEVDLEAEKKKVKNVSKKKPQGKIRLDPKEMDRIELAFRRLDVDKDGYLSREEFDQMMKNVAKDQADRIFDSCDTVGDNQISMEEFRKMVSKKDNASQK